MLGQEQPALDDATKKLRGWSLWRKDARQLDSSVKRAVSDFSVDSSYDT